MVFITHDFLEAIKMGDHIAIMKDGEVSQVGTPEEIVANPKDQYVKDFCEDVPKYKVLSASKVMREECWKKKPNKPFRAKYFSSNLTGSEETQKDFAYFNNASSIFAGHEIFSMS